MKVSNCCGYEIGDPHFIDIGICPACKEHCDFEEVCVEEEEKQKTALMELILFMSPNRKDRYKDPSLCDIQLKAYELLQKERQQIIDAYWAGLNGSVNDYSESKEVGSFLTGIKLGGGAEYYYNKTYKQ